MHAVIAICIGASLGALARWRLGLWLSHPGGWLPWGTLAANWIGAYAIGLAVAAFHHQPQLDPQWRLFIITGLLGGLTTFSSFSAEVVDMLLQRRHAQAAATLALHVGGSLLLTLAGIRTAGWWLAR